MSHSLGETRRDFCAFSRECGTILELAFERENMPLQIFRWEAETLKRAATGLIMLPVLGGAEEAEKRRNSVFIHGDDRVCPTGEIPL